MPRVKIIQDDSFEPSNSHEAQKGNYSLILYETRLKLIKKVKQGGMSILRAAKALDIKPSTAKYIYKCFRDEGRVMKKTKKWKKTQRKRQVSSENINQSEIYEKKSEVKIEEKMQDLVKIQPVPQHEIPQKKQVEAAICRQNYDSYFHHLRSPYVPILPPWGAYYMPFMNAYR